MTVNLCLPDCTCRRHSNHAGGRYRDVTKVSRAEDLRGQGVCLEDIATDLNVCRETIRRWLSEHKSCRRCGSDLRSNAKYGFCSKPECAKSRAKYADSLDKEAVFSHYGRACVCCGSSAEAVDHIDPQMDGRLHSNALYKRIIAEGFPSDKYQAMCKACNSSKGTGTDCNLVHTIAGAPYIGTYAANNRTVLYLSDTDRDETVAVASWLAAYHDKHGTWPGECR